MPDVVIIGGGISGLSTAYYLAKAGAASTILESRPRLGGVIQTDHVEGCTIEAGPDSFLSAKPAALDLIRDLGLARRRHRLERPSPRHLRAQRRPPGPPARRPHDDGAHQDPAAPHHPAAELGHQVPHGHGAFRAPTLAARATNRWPNSSTSTTAAKRWTTWPSRCSPASTAATPASSASPACCRDLSSSPAATAASRAACWPYAPRPIPAARPLPSSAP